MFKRPHRILVVFTLVVLPNVAHAAPNQYGGYNIQLQQRNNKLFAIGTNEQRELDNVKDWYCAESSNDTETFNQMDVGAPLIYQEKENAKGLLGLFTGWNKEQKSKGRMFTSLWPSIKWIENFILDRPIAHFRV